MVTRFWPMDKTLAVFTKEWITFRKTFRTAFWDRDFNYMYVRSHALQTPSQSRPGSAHCEVIFCSHHCAVRADWPMHGFSAHFQNAHARITLRKNFAFTLPRIRLSMRITIQTPFFSRFKSVFQKPDLKELCVHKG